MPLIIDRCDEIHQCTMEEKIQRMSESMFMVLCEIGGTSEQVAIRRETRDIWEIVGKKVTKNNGIIRMLSGSIREGLRLKGSDMDYMYWLNNYRIIMNMTQSKNYNTTNTTLILSDTSESPPGFTPLQLLTPTQNREIQSICVRMNDRVYIFSSLVIQLACSRIIPHSSVHGPCGSGNIAGD